jgi:hypothetical protein
VHSLARIQDRRVTDIAFKTRENQSNYTFDNRILYPTHVDLYFWQVKEKADGVLNPVSLVQVKQKFI